MSVICVSRSAYAPALVFSGAGLSCAYLSAKPRIVAGNPYTSRSGEMPYPGIASKYVRKPSIIKAIPEGVRIFPKDTFARLNSVSTSMYCGLVSICGGAYAGLGSGAGEGAAAGAAASTADCGAAAASGGAAAAGASLTVAGGISPPACGPAQLHATPERTGYLRASGRGT